ncbi:MAG: hypothetical protein K2Y28_06085 [Burkholderiaceae bacterium]|nr:hypothetical protein [Burkholderiaceae bacterium]
MSDPNQKHVFCLTHSSGDQLYPVLMKNRSTGVIAYRVSLGGNTKADHIELSDPLEVLRYVRDLGYSVRAQSPDSGRNGLYKAGQRSITSLNIFN